MREIQYFITRPRQQEFLTYDWLKYWEQKIQALFDSHAVPNLITEILVMNLNLKKFPTTRRINIARVTVQNLWVALRKFRCSSVIRKLIWIFSLWKCLVFDRIIGFTMMKELDTCTHLLNQSV